MDVSGGGPLSPDAAAVARINAQLPDTGDIQVSGSEALAYAGKLAAFAPSLGPAFEVFNTISSCALDYGVIAARAYVTPDYRVGAVMLVVSGHQLEILPQTALQCFVSNVIGGGDTGGFSPCFENYQYDGVTGGFTDRYYVFIAATHQAACPSLSTYHTKFNPVPIGS